ncbi:hypothetical protein DmAi_20320 [Acetobacter persici]|uniref:Uncharacterized protein n=1 Tax=Acetobacter persici TaxID=1076596 RepID=A0A6V8I8R2_9PROT|nr:hypothetical protein DmAi_20320 [Acetobacter persici]
MLGDLEGIILFIPVFYLLLYLIAYRVVRKFFP